MRPDKRGTKIDLRPPQAEAVTVDRQHVAGHQTRAGLQTSAEPRSMPVPQAAITFPRPFKAPHPNTEGTVASIPRHFASVWSKYELFTSTHHRKDLAGATRSRGIRERVFVVHVAKSEAKSRLSIVNRVSCPYVAAVSETYESPTALDFVCDFFELTLVHFQNHTVVLEEKAIAAVAGQVKCCQESRLLLLILSQVVSALRYLSDQNLVVSSLEPDTIFVAYQTGAVKICKLYEDVITTTYSPQELLVPTDLRHNPDKPRSPGIRNVRQFGQILFDLVTEHDQPANEIDSHALTSLDSNFRDFIEATEEATAAQLARVCRFSTSYMFYLLLTYILTSIPSCDVIGNRATCLDRSLCC